MIVEEKIFNLMEKMYIEMQEMKEKMATKDDIRKLENNMVRMEDEVKDDIKILYDGYKQSIEGINDIKERLDKLSDKVENQEIKLQVLKTAK